MVGLQRPQGDPGIKSEDRDEDDNKMICFSNKDDFILTQVNLYISYIFGHRRGLVAYWVSFYFHSSF